MSGFLGARRRAAAPDGRYPDPMIPGIIGFEFLGRPASQ